VKVRVAWQYFIKFSTIIFNDISPAVLIVKSYFFWDVMPCSVLKSNWPSRGICCPSCYLFSFWLICQADDGDNMFLWNISLPSADYKALGFTQPLTEMSTRNIKIIILNCWVLHPVARVSTNTLIKTTVLNKCFYARFIVYYLQHVLAPIGGHLQVKCTQKYI
jgi:hypothetical protein